MIPVREFTTADEVIANIRRLRGVFYPSRPIAPTRVETPPKEAGLKQVSASTPQDAEGSADSSEAPVTSAEVERGPEFLEQLEKWLALSATPALSNHATARQLTRECAERHGFTYNDVIGGGRKKELVRARHEAMAAVYQALSPAWSLPKIGMFFGGRDHTTVLHALKKMKVRNGEGA